MIVQSDPPGMGFVRIEHGWMKIMGKQACLSCDRRQLTLFRDMSRPRIFGVIVGTDASELGWDTIFNLQRSIAMYVVCFPQHVTLRNSGWKCQEDFLEEAPGRNAA